MALSGLRRPESGGPDVRQHLGKVTVPVGASGTNLIRGAAKETSSLVDGRKPSDSTDAGADVGAGIERAGGGARTLVKKAAGAMGNRLTSSGSTSSGGVPSATKTKSPGAAEGMRRGGFVTEKAAARRAAKQGAQKARKATARTVNSAGSAISSQTVLASRASAEAATRARLLFSAITSVAGGVPTLVITIISVIVVAVLIAVLGWLIPTATRPTSNYSVGIQEPGPWGGYSNGMIPESALAPIPWSPAQHLRPDAAAALTALNGEFRAAFGYDLPINDAYRTYAQQVIDKATYGNGAAEPGQSNHGWALAVDIGDQSHIVISYDHPIYLWLVANAGKFGWKQPPWAVEGGQGPHEAWHWEFWGTDTGNAGGDARAYARTALGGDPLQFDCLSRLWDGESGWNPHAENPDSGAYGIPQALPADKLAEAGADWRDNPITQVKWGLSYISDRYGTPCQAWAFWQGNNPHWY